jgi:hypothetical protein
MLTTNEIEALRVLAKKVGLEGIHKMWYVEEEDRVWVDLGTANRYHYFPRNWLNERQAFDKAVNYLIETKKQSELVH